MNRQTINAEVRGKTFSIAPAQPGSGLVINGIQIQTSRVIHSEHRVDVRQQNRIAFIIEHPVAVATVFGIHDAVITGIRQSWDFYRASDREAYARDLPPSAILGLADGSIGGDITESMERASIVETCTPLEIYSLAKPVEFESNDGNVLSIEPASPGRHTLEISLQFFNLGPLHATLDPVKGLHDDRNGEDIKLAVLRARSGAVIGLKDEALLHAVGDVVADIAGTGNIRAGKVEAKLGMGYHKATMGIVKEIYEQGLAVPAK
jgi:hypothetical protein